MREKLQERGCDPIVGLIEIAENKNASLELRAHCHAKLSRFVYPELRSVEHSGPGGGPIHHAVDPLEAITSELSRLAERNRQAEGSPKT